MKKVTLHCLCKGLPDIIRIVGTCDINTAPDLENNWGMLFVASLNSKKYLQKADSIKY